MLKFIMGVIVGILVTTYYPDVVPLAKQKLLEPGGARDSVVDSLKEIK